MSHKEPAALFTKNQFLNSKQRPGKEKDILASVLEDGKSYTIVEAEEAIQSYLKRSVN
ncbi:MAG TPA: hypothetical protein IAA29_00345 [Candidatus Paenibacillus intestinavium]|nr:hypothetical protein [Candidatus Paenibacillus intestinavium]